MGAGGVKVVSKFVRIRVQKVVLLQAALLFYYPVKL